MDRAASSEPSLTAAQLGLLHGGWILMLAAAGAVVGYAVVCAVSLVGVKARPLSSRRVPTRVSPDGTLPEEPLS